MTNIANRGPHSANMTTLIWRGSYAALVYRFKTASGDVGGLQDGWTFSVFYRQHVLGGNVGSMEFGTPDPNVRFITRESALSYAEDVLAERERQDAERAEQDAIVARVLSRG